MGSRPGANVLQFPAMGHKWALLTIPAGSALAQTPDPAWGEQVLRGVLNDRGEYSRGCWMGIVGTRLNTMWVPPGEVVAVKSDALKALGEHSSPAAQQAEMNAFRVWHDCWKDRPAEMVSEGQFEQAFLQASMRAQNWLANGEALEKVRELCVTAGCRDHAAQYIRVWGGGSGFDR
jgi:hypothetical protein